jgi:hypothetical protein
MGTVIVVVILIAAAGAIYSYRSKRERGAGEKPDVQPPLDPK